MPRFLHRNTDRDLSVENLPVFDALLTVVEALDEKQREQLLKPLNRVAAVFYQAASALSCVEREEDLCYYCRRMVKAAQMLMHAKLVDGRPSPEKASLLVRDRGRAPILQGPLVEGMDGAAYIDEDDDDDEDDEDEGAAA